MNYTTRSMFGTYDPYLADAHIALCRKYWKSKQHANIKQDEVIYHTEKWKYLRTFFEAEELADCIEKANDEFYKKWYSQQQKIYYDKNTEKIRQQQSVLYALNKEKMQEREKRYRETHKEQIYEKNKKYTAIHKDEINEKHKIKTICECGAQIRLDYMTKHKKIYKAYWFSE